MYDSACYCNIDFEKIDATFFFESRFFFFEFREMKQKSTKCRARNVENMTLKQLINYMKKRNICHSFIERDELFFFVAQIYGKSNKIITSCVEANPAVWLNDSMATKKLRQRTDTS